MSADRSGGGPGRSVRLAADDRGRVPFALVGVLLLVSSVAYAGAMDQQGYVDGDRAVADAMERTDAETTTALRSAARAAAMDAGAEPVTSPPDGPAGEAVRNGSAFEDALRIRIAIAAADALAAIETRRGDVTAEASLPIVTGTEDLVAARDRVSVEPVADGTAMRVTVRNVTATATRDGRVVTERTTDRTVVVAVPLLAAHERTERFEERLNRGPLEGAGLGRQLSARLYPVTWARGYGQYRGAPIRNVLANRHVELSANAGAAHLQRDVFGAADSDTDAGVRRATAETGTTDLIAPTSLDEESWTDAIVDGADTLRNDTRSVEPSGNGTRTVSANASADAAFSSTLDRIDEVARDAYRVEASLTTRSRLVSMDGSDPDPPGDDWRLADETRHERVTVETNDGSANDGSAGSGSTGDGTGFGSATRTVVVEETVVREWTDGTDRERTRSTRTERYRVTVAVEGGYAPVAGAPDRPTDPTFETGSPVDGPNLADAPATARSALDAASVDALARRTVQEGEVTRETVVVGERPPTLHDWIRDDLAELHADVRGIETEVSMADVAGDHADPYGVLADEIEQHREKLVDAPETYDGAADRARVAARVAYLDAVVDELEDRSSARADTHEELESSVPFDDFGGDSAGAFLDGRTADTDADPFTVAPDGPGGGVTLRPDATPGYLPRTIVEGETVDGLDDDVRTRPLATRNLNYVTVPYGDVADGIVDKLLGSEGTVGLGDAGRTLVAADETLAHADDPGLRADRDRLEHEVADGVDAVESDVDVVLRSETGLDEAERRSVLAAAHGSDHAGQQAIAMADGRYAERVAAEVADREDRSVESETVLASRLRTTTAEATVASEATVPRALANDTAVAARDVARAELSGAIEDGLDEAGSTAADHWATEPIRAIGAGLPVAPVPGYWYATVNAWRVDVGGEYPRFAVETAGGPPGESFSYVRQSDTVTIDIDGESVALGETDPVRFETGTVVLVAVPPGPPGVGDVDGVRDDPSDGWPCPGPVDRECPEGSRD